jgi:nucleotide-binding universal stress UspA family protein
VPASGSLALTVGVLHVVSDPATIPWAADGLALPVCQIAEQWRRDAAGRLRGAVKPADVERVTVASTIASPVGGILRYAATEDVDLIVMGTHGRGGVSHMLLGSIAERIVRRAPCPVLTVRYPEHGFVETQALVGIGAQAPTASAT